MKIGDIDKTRFFDLDHDSKMTETKVTETKSVKNKKNYGKNEPEDLYDLDLRIKEMVSDLPLAETGQTGNCTGTGRCSRGCQTQQGHTCVRCGPTEYVTCGSCRCR